MRTLLRLFHALLTCSLISSLALGDGIRGVNYHLSFYPGYALRADDGTVGAPGVTFKEDLDSGIYRIGADSFGLSAGGVLRAQVDTTGLVVPAGQTLGLAGATVGGQPTFTLSQTFPGITSSNGLTVNGALGTFNAGLSVPSGQTLTSAGTTTLNGILNGNATATWTGVHEYKRTVSGSPYILTVNNQGVASGSLAQIDWKTLGGTASVHLARDGNQFTFDIPGIPDIMHFRADLGGSITLNKPVTAGPSGNNGLGLTVNGYARINRNGTSENPVLQLYGDANNFSSFYWDQLNTYGFGAKSQLFQIFNGGVISTLGLYKTNGTWELGPRTGVETAIAHSQYFGNLSRISSVKTGAAGVGWMGQRFIDEAAAIRFEAAVNIATNGYATGAAGDVFLASNSKDINFTTNLGTTIAGRINTSDDWWHRGYTSLGDNPGSGTGKNPYFKVVKLSGTLDNDASTTIPHGISSGASRIIAVMGKVRDVVGTWYAAPTNNVPAEVNRWLQFSWNDTNIITFNGSLMWSQPYVLYVFYEAS